MTSVGDTLRRERLQRKLDLDQISRELKISRRLLDAIETDQYDLLPGSMFAKAFVRQYAGLLGLDGESALVVAAVRTDVMRQLHLVAVRALLERRDADGEV